VAYDATIADRIRPLMIRQPGCAEKKMFGGVGFLLHGNMCVGVWKEFLIARVGAHAYDDALAKPGVHEFDITGRPMRGWVMVDPSGARDDLALSAWVDAAIEFVRTLPPK
jgi:TfoX/Sxy family transcriptional regulator of competence genes